MPVMNKTVCKTPDEIRAYKAAWVRTWRLKNPEKAAAYAKALRLKYPERFAAYDKTGRLKNREKRKTNRKTWGLKNPEKIVAYAKARALKTKLVRSLRNRVRKALVGKIKSASSLALLGMDTKEYRIYLQGQFKLGLTWQNYGMAWQIDHIKPCASFDLTDPAQQRECFNWSNTQPLSTAEHKEKHAVH